MTHLAITREELERAEDEIYSTEDPYQPGLDKIIKDGPHYAALAAPSLAIARTHGSELAVKLAALSCYIAGLTVGLQIAANRTAKQQQDLNQAFNEGEGSYHP